MESEEHQAEVIDGIKDFIKSRGSYFELDKKDFIRSANLSAGNGWFDRLGKAWGEARANLTINPLKKIVDSTCNAFLRNPFKFEGLDDLANEKINNCLFECLRDACNDGVGYFYMHHDESGKIHFKKLDNQAVMYSETEALVIEKKKREGKKPLASQSSAWQSNTEVLALAPDEYPVLYYFKKLEGAVKICQVEDSHVTAESELPIPRIPIVPVKCKSIKLKHETHYRGYYYEFQDCVASMNACMSKAAEIAISRTPVVLAEESLGSSEYQEQHESNEPRNLYIYKAFMQACLNGVDQMIPLPKPEWVPHSQDLQTLNSQIASLKEYINDSAGTNLASEGLSNETATAVLLRNESKQAALSEMLFNINHSAKEIAETLAPYISFLSGNELAEIKVVDQAQASYRNQNAIQLLLSVASMPPRVQLSVLQLYGAPEELVQSVAKTIEEQGADPEKEQLRQQLQMEQLRAKEAEGQVMAAKVEAEQRYATKMQELAIEEKIKMAQIALEHEKLKLEWAKLGQKDNVDQIGLMQNAEAEGAKIAEKINQQA